MTNIETHKYHWLKKMLSMVLSDGTEERNSVKSSKYNISRSLHSDFTWVSSQGNKTKCGTILSTKQSFMGNQLAVGKEQNHQNQTNNNFLQFNICLICYLKRNSKPFFFNLSTY